MATPISDLPQPDSIDADSSWLLIEQDSTLYKIQASSFLRASSIQTQYTDSIYQLLGFNSSTISFEKQNLLNIDSNFIVVLDFSEKIKLPSATLIKNSGSNVFSILTHKGVSDFNIDAESTAITLSSYSSQDGKMTNIVADIVLSKGILDSISFTNLKLQNVSDLASFDTAYCCAKINGQVVNS